MTASEMYAWVIGFLANGLSTEMLDKGIEKRSPAYGMLQDLILFAVDREEEVIKTPSTDESLAASRLGYVSGVVDAVISAYVGHEKDTFKQSLEGELMHTYISTVGENITNWFESQEHDDDDDDDYNV